MANYYTNFSFAIDNITEKEAEWLDEFTRAVNLEIEDDMAWFWSLGDDSFDIDDVIEIIQDFLFEFRPKDVVAFTYAATCSKPRLYGFSGGAICVTKDDIVSSNTEGWMADTAERLRKSLKA